MDTSPEPNGTRERRCTPMSDDGTAVSNDGDDQQTPDATEDQSEDLQKQLQRLEADAKKWKSIALKHEQTAKANADAAKRLKEMELAGKSETEKLQTLLEEARAEARTARITALRHQVAAEKGLPPSLAKFLPDVDNEVDMTAAAEALLEAAGAGEQRPATRQPKSKLLTPLAEDDEETSRQQVIAAMQGKSPI